MTFGLGLTCAGGCGLKGTGLGIEPPGGGAIGPGIGLGIAPGGATPPVGGDGIGLTVVGGAVYAGPAPGIFLFSFLPYLS